MEVAMASTNEEVVKRYAAASSAGDLETLAALRTPDWKADWPQSGEHVPSSEAELAVRRAYPGGAPVTRLERLVGSEDRFVVTPSNTVARIVGSGDAWWGEWRIAYPDGIDYHCVALLELRDGLVRRETVYWAAPFDAPGWRAPWVQVRKDPA
jgi:ketosteroid isomerase-like protein